MRVAKLAAKRALTSGRNEVVDCTFQRSTALLLTLLTFWPPGPELLAKETSSSEAGIAICELITSGRDISEFQWPQSAGKHRLMEDVAVVLKMRPSQYRLEFLDPLAALG